MHLTGYLGGYGSVEFDGDASFTLQALHLLKAHVGIYVPFLGHQDDTRGARAKAV
jgi:hypothetical protein